jgi:YVTN family beta-propeller protein
MVKVGQEVYVTNWSKVYVEAENNTVQVIDANNDIKVADITVGKEPNSMVVDKNGMVWVLCEGAMWDAEPGLPELWKIDPVTKQASMIVQFTETAMNMAIDPEGTHLYYVRGGDWVSSGDLHRVSIDNPTVEEDFVIPAEGRMFYKVFVNPNNGDIYLSDSKNYVTNGTVYRYSSDGVLLNSFDAGICPGYMLFN